MTRRRRPPIVATSIGGLAGAFLLLPLAGLAWRAPWSSIVDDLTDPAARTALRLSLQCSLWATFLAAAVGLSLIHI